MDITWLAVGLGSGVAAGINVGMSIGAKKERKKLLEELKSAIEKENISVLSKDGSRISDEELLSLLSKTKKAEADKR